jgi:sugar lactone lactonase YvrE
MINKFRNLLIPAIYLFVCGCGGSNSQLLPSQFLLGITVDSSVTPHTLYVTDINNNLIEKVSSLTGTNTTLSQVISTLSLKAPAGITVSGGNLFVADLGNDLIRKVTSISVVPSLVNTNGIYAGAIGGSSTTPSRDGPKLSAYFNQPEAIALDGFGNVFVADSLNHVIREISSAGQVVTIAGQVGTAGIASGTGAQAQFNNPSALVIDSSNNLYVVDEGNSAIRMLTSSACGVNQQNSTSCTWTVSNFAGSPTANLSCPNYQDVATVNLGTPATNAKFCYPFGIAYDGAGNLFIADEYNQVIRKIAVTVPAWDLNGINLPVATSVTTLAGSRSNNYGFNDNSGLNTTFYLPTGIVYDSTTPSLYVIDQFGTHIRIVNPSNGSTSTLY